MRTTLTLDDETAALVREAMKRSNKSLKATINEAIKRGLLLPENKKSKRQYATRPFDAGELLAGDVSNIGEVLTRMDEQRSDPR